ncbi:MAG: DEAD/DEAH box helicase [Candidatus Limnocylindrales bacterium]
MKTFYKHQKAFLDRNPDKALLLWEFGTGKTLAAIEWLKLRTERKALVVCPKALAARWRRDLAEAGIIADVLTRDAVKTEDISSYKTIVIDEAHDFASPLFNKQRSQRAAKIYLHIKNHPDTQVLLLTATPIRSTHWNIHTLACYIGHYWDVKKFRDEFEHMTDKFGRYHYEPDHDWRRRIRKYVELVSDIVLLRDCFDVPIQHEQVIKVPWTARQENTIGEMYLEPAKEWHERHRAENGLEKLAKLKELTDGYRKVIVVCYYTEQIASYSAEIGKERQVFTLQGSTKDQDAVITAAREADDCVFFVQASMGNGFDASEFSVMIFASQSFKFVDNIQTKGRILRANDLHENTYIYLIGGKTDQKVFDVIKLGHDFHPPSYL